MMRRGPSSRPTSVACGRPPAGCGSVVDAHHDCLTYAVANLARQPLLCLGDDVARTDLDVIRP